MTAKIQNLNGTHNRRFKRSYDTSVVYDCKDTKFEWNSQLGSFDTKEQLGCL